MLLSENRYITKYKKFIVVISYGDFHVMHGGVSRYLFEYTDFLTEHDYGSVFFYPQTIKTADGKKTIAVKWGCRIDGADLKKSFSVDSVIAIINKNICAKREITEFHLHHLRDIPLKELEKIFDNYSGCNIKFFLHDYYTVCPNYNLLKNDKIFCGGPTSKFEECKDCKYSVVSKERSNVTEALFKRYKNRLTIISPSEAAADIWKKRWRNLCDVIILPHQKCSRIEKNRIRKKYGDIIRIAFVGSGTVSKGYTYWQEATQNKIKKIEFYEYSNKKTKNQNIIHKMGFFDKDNLNYMSDCLKKDKIDIVILWSVWPETYSYTFFESLCADCAVLTNEYSGNVAKMVEQYQNGKVFLIDELKHILSDYDLLYDVLDKYNPDVSYEAGFNEELLGLIKRADKAANLSGGNTRIKNSLFFNLIYKIYNWIRIHIVKV